MTVHALVLHIVEATRANNVLRYSECKIAKNFPLLCPCFPMRGRSVSFYFQGGACPMRSGGGNFLGAGSYPSCIL